jgi:hypothetical protein
MTVLSADVGGPSVLERDDVEAALIEPGLHGESELAEIPGLRSLEFEGEAGFIEDERGELRLSVIRREIVASQRRRRWSWQRW